MTDKTDDLEQQINDYMESREVPEVEPDSIPDAPVLEPESTTESETTESETPEPVDLPDNFTINGVNYPKDQVVQLISWAQGLSQDHVRNIDRALGDEYVLVHKDQYSTLQAETKAREEEKQSQYVDEALAQEVQELKTRLAQLDSTQQEFNNQRTQQTMTNLSQAFEEAKSEFRGQYTLTDQEFDTLVSHTEQLNIIPALSNKNPGDPKTVFIQGLKAGYFSHPEFQQREVQRQLVTNDKKSKAAALSAPSGTVPAQGLPTDPEERRNAMIQEIAASLNHQ